jgi:voltage-gated potassium channel
MGHMAPQDDTTSKHSNAYNLFILLLTIFALILMVLMLLPLDRDTLTLLHFYDILICCIFLVDFFINLKVASSKSAYFIQERGWLDLLGSLPSLGVVFKFSGLLRLARLSRFERILRHRHDQDREDMITDVIKHRHRYVGYITILLTLIILSTASALVLQFESRSPKASITTGWDAVWFSIVTITTVGYGDFYPVTFMGQVTAMFIMISGIGIIAVLASLMSRMLIGQPSGLEEREAPDTASPPTVEQELAIIKEEVAALRQLLEKTSQEGDE